MVNWTIFPFKNVEKGVVRFRILNGSNERIYNFNLSTWSEFYQIASDWGFLESPVKMNSLQLAPWERAEILIDFSSYNLWESVKFQSNYKWEAFDVMEFRVTKEAKNIFTIPTSLVKIEKIKESESIKTRPFILETMKNWMMWDILTINWKNMNISRIDEKIKLWTTEIWEIENKRWRWMNFWHPFHIHDIQFQILDRNWKKPPENERGWKDTVFVKVWEKVRVITKFDDYTWIYMYHCHILEHEDNWMMWQFEVVK